MDAVNHIKLRVERSAVSAVLTAILSAIYFHRNLDNVEPFTLDVLDTHVAVIAGSGGDEAKAVGAASFMEREIASNVDEFVRTIVEQQADSGEIAVVFLQRKNKKGWFAVTEALVPWEEHRISLTFVTRATLNPLPSALMQLLTFCAERKNNVPPLLGSSDQSLSHQIIVSPPPSYELFGPSSPPPGPVRLTSPPPTSLTTPSSLSAASGTPITGSPVPRRPASSGGRVSLSPAADSARRATSPRSTFSDAGSSAMGYLEQAKDGLLAVGAKAGGWGRK